MNIAKKYGTLILLSIVLASSCVQIINAIYLKVHQYTVWQKLQKTLPLQQVSFTTMQWSNYTNAIYTPSEIEIQGKMFDIKNINHTKNGVVLNGFFDEHEDAIKSKIAKDVQQKNKLKSKMPFLTLLYFTATTHNNFKINCFTVLQKPTSFFCNNYFLNKFSQIKHPPQV